jgi:uncharacterized C2H2 Zn-finger protein
MFRKTAILRGVVRMYCCPKCTEFFDDEDEFFEHVTECDYDEDMG